MMQTITRYCLIVVFFAFPAMAEPLRPNIAYSQDDVTIRTKKEDITLKLEVASSAPQMTNGLMYRKTLPPDGGMIFLFPQNGPVVMWMKNTYISLDMLFIDQKGTIITIAENTTPESTEHISSGGDATGVIELVAGSAKRLNIAKGDKVIYPHFHE